MSNFFDFTLGNDRRKQLLAQLLGQMAGSGSPSALPLFGGGHGRSQAELPSAPIPQITVPFPIAPGLLAQLGPGGAGNPGAAHSSAAPGIPVGASAPAGIDLNRINMPDQGAAIRRLFGGSAPTAPIFRGQVLPHGRVV